MAKILIPFSGGINSTYALWRFLKETEHEIVVFFGENEEWLKERHKGDNSIYERVTNKADTIIAYLKSTIRDFEYKKGIWDTKTSEELIPIRIGGTNTWNVAPMRPRWNGYVDLINEIKPDGFVFGLSLENTFTDVPLIPLPLIQNTGVDLYLAGCTELFTPIEKITEDNCNEFLKTQLPIGRFYQKRSLPLNLSELVSPECSIRHNSSELEEHGNICMKCLYEEVLETRTDLSGSELDALFAERGQYGQWRDNADLEIYTYRGNSEEVAFELLGVSRPE
jgi:hypothetical protein